MTQSFITLDAPLETEEWRPSYGIIATVAVAHMLLAATILTAVQTPLKPSVLQSVDIVTLPSDQPVNQSAPSTFDPITIEPNVPERPADTKFGPRITDRRLPPIPPTPEKAAESLDEAKAVSVPVPTPAPVPTPVPVAVPTPVNVPQPTQNRATTPVIKAEALPAPALVLPNMPVPSRIELKAKTDVPILADVAPAPLVVRSEKLKRVDTKSLTTNATPKLPEPALASEAPRPDSALPNPAPLPRAAPSPMPPIANVVPTPFVPKSVSPTLPKVQVPRVNAVDLRLPNAPAAPTQSSSGSASGLPKSGGVTSLSPEGGAASDGRSAANGGGSGATGGAGARPSSQSSSPSSASGGGGASGNAPGGATGTLPRRPGGAGVRQEFPRDNTTLLGRMDQTFDCSRMSRERDARCPDWDPIEGRNSRAIGTIAAPIPKGITPPRYGPGTNPLPVCPPGTPGSQMGLSCLPSRHGPGVPRP